MKLKPRLRTALRQHTIVMMSVGATLLLGLLVTVYLNTANVTKAHAAASGDYRSASTGNWNNAATWQIYNGSAWIAASLTPASTDGAIEIQSGHTVTVSASVTADQVVVDTGATLTVSSGITLTINNGAGTDICVNGTLNNTGTITQSSSTYVAIYGTYILGSAATYTIAAGAKDTVYSGGRFKRNGGTLTTTTGFFVINPGATFQHNMDAGALPLATWGANSTCEVTGVVATQPTNLNQTFNNFTWNCPAQTQKEDLGGNLLTINGDFNCISTGSGSILLGSGSPYNHTIGGDYNHQGGTLYIATTKASTLTVSGNYNQSGGNFYYMDSVGGGDGQISMTVTGDFILSGGRYVVSSNTTSALNDGVSTTNLYGNFTQTGGVFSETANTAATYGYGNVYFKKTGTQTFSLTGGTLSNTINFTINSGAILDMGTSILTSGGTFTLASGGGIIVADANGITSSGSSGNIQVTGARSYNTGADYTYNGAVAQNTGNGLPATVHNLTLNNTSNLTLTSTISVSNLLTFTAGNFITNANTLVLGTSTAVLGTLARTSGHVVGNFKRWIAAAATSNILFPVGTLTDYRGANYSFTVAPTAAGSITINYVYAILTMGGPNFFDSPDSMQTLGTGYWNTASGDGLTAGTFSLDLTATNLFGVNNYAKLHLVRRTNGASPWTIQGTHSAATGSNTIPVVHRTGLTSYAHFGIASPSGSNPLPIELISFDARLNKNHVDLTWETADEMNNDYFTVERSSDAKNFEMVLRKQGAGNSTGALYYSGIDENPLHGYSYYRLKQTDYDGHYSYSEIKTVKYKSNEEESGFQISSVAPNPFSERFRVSFILKKSADVTIHLINSSGQIVFKDVIYTEDGMNQYDFEDNLGLNPGVYFLILYSDDQKISQKVVKK